MRRRRRPSTQKKSHVAPGAARDRVLADWRRADLKPLEVAASLRARSLAEVMPGVLRDLGLDRRRAEAEIVRVWNHLIDPAITRHAQPSRLVRGTLYVTVDNNVWLSEIVRYRQREVLERLRHSFGRDVIARISWRVG